MGAHWILPFIITQSMALQPQGGGGFTFVQCSETGKHVAVQPKADYHRVHFHVRVQGKRDRRLYGRVRFRPVDGEESTVTTIFRPTTNNEVWSMYFRVPRFAKRTATYQIELGEHQPSQLNEYSTRTSFAWQIPRDQDPDNPPFIHKKGNSAVVMTIPTRSARVEGGRIVISIPKAALKAVPMKIRYGWSYQGSEKDIDGASMAKKVQ